MERRRFLAWTAGGIAAAGLPSWFRRAFAGEEAKGGEEGPYGDLAAQRVQRFAELADLDVHRTTIEEREEYEPHITSGTVIYAGVDYGAILAQAETEGDVVLWDGGNNDLPFYRPDVWITLVDPLRPGHELRYHPGEANLRAADVLLVNKVDSATPEQLEQIRATIDDVNPSAAVVEATSLP